MEKSKKTVVALAGGVGAAKLLKGFYDVMDPENLHIIINTGDDCSFFNLHISPDIDIVTYWLAGAVDLEKYWGIHKDTFNLLGALERFYGPQWFNLGDQDLGTHLYRSDALAHGQSLTEVTQDIAKKFGLKAHLYPMANEAVPTFVDTDIGLLPFQEYFVKHRWTPKVSDVLYRDAESATLNPKFSALFEKADIIVVCPSNPWLSVAPILAIPGMKNLLKQNSHKTIGVCPLVGGQALKGPTRQIMESFGIELNSVGVANFYRDLLKHYVIDQTDIELRDRFKDLNMQVYDTDIVMDSEEKRRTLAKFILNLL